MPKSFFEKRAAPGAAHFAVFRRPWYFGVARFCSTDGGKEQLHATCTAVVPRSELPFNNPPPNHYLHTWTRFHLQTLPPAFLAVELCFQCSFLYSVLNPGGWTQKRSEVVATMPMPQFSGKLAEGESPAVQNVLAVPGLNCLADDSDLGASPVVCVAERISRNCQLPAFGLGVL